MSLRTVRTAIQEVLREECPNLRVYPELRSVITVPAIVITPSTGPNEKSADFDGRTFGSWTWFLDLMVMVHAGNLEQAQQQLDALVSPDEPGSLPAILDSRSPGVLLDSPTIDILKVVELRDYGGSYSAADVDHIGACLKLEVSESSC